ncbi:MAG TPA: cyclase family protein [Pseudonocardiaceae bacterium]|jgi:kynurenine formamidase|nr:cyclase family protein [Pseudonocardiaceae bacterium]
MAGIEDLARKLSNWDRWGPDDQAGTVNHITPAKVAAAAGLVRRGHIEQLGIPLGHDGPQITGSTRFNPLHFMTALHDHDVRPDGSAIADDVLMLPLQAGTQWDALAHYSHQGRLYGGRPASLVTTRGAQTVAIAAVSGQIMTRGVLVDLPRHFGVDTLEPGRPVGVADLEAALAETGTEVGAGDALLVRTGFLEHCRRRGWTGYKGDSPGLDIDTLSWLHQRQIAAVATDTCFVEVRPSTVPGVRAPFHLVGIVYMGLLLGEIFDLESLAENCHRAGSHEFLLVAPPLPVTGGIGSPINPYAVS